jgi:leucyl/phenylalanyl-tRNA--protein transferase
VAEFRLSQSLRKTLRRFAGDARCEIRIDSDLRGVISACAAAPREGQQGTWIAPEVIDAYCAWRVPAGAPDRQAQGPVSENDGRRAHSVETWIAGELAGGLYGVGIGRMFYGESMFARRSDASKIALAALVAWCRAHGITLIDCQQHTLHLASLGAREISRAEFEAHLSRVLGEPPPPRWTYHRSLWTQLGMTLAEIGETP